MTHAAACAYRSRRYHGVVSVYDRLGNERKCASSGTVFDATAPEVGVLVSRLAANPDLSPQVQSVSSQVSIEARGLRDDEAGIRQIYTAVGNADAPEALQELRPAGVDNSDILVTGLTLADGVHVLTVTAENNAEESSTERIEFGVDTIEPRCVGISFANTASEFTASASTFTNASQGIAARWNCSDAAPWDAVPLSCVLGVGSSPGNDDLLQVASTCDGALCSPFTGSGSYESLDFELTPGVLLYARVRCEDQAANFAFAVSRALLSDPLPPVVTAQAALVSPELRQTDFLGSADGAPVRNLSFTFGFVDFETTVEGVRATIVPAGATSSPTPPWEQLEISIPMEMADARLASMLLPGEPLVHRGRYLLHVAAIDQAGNVAHSEPALFTVDLTPPTCLRPNQTVGEALEPPIFSTPSGLAATWFCFDEESGVVTTSWMPYADGVPLLAKPIVRAGHQLQSGLTGEVEAYRIAISMFFRQGVAYHSCVTAINGARQRSADSCSRISVYDGTPPQRLTAAGLPASKALGEAFRAAGQLTPLVPAKQAFLYVDGDTEYCPFWTPYSDNQSSVTSLTWQLLREHGRGIEPTEIAVFQLDGAAAVEPRLNSAPIDGSRFFGQPWVSSCAINGGAISTAALEHGAKYFSRVLVWNGAKPPLQTEDRSQGFVVDKTPPTAGHATIRTQLPQFFELQAGHPQTVTALRIVVSFDGSYDLESGIREHEVSVHADGVLVDAGKSQGTVPYVSSELPSIANGTTFTVAVRAINGAYLFAEVSASPVLLNIQQINLERPAVLDYIGKRVARSNASRYAEQRGIFAIEFSRAIDPTQPTPADAFRDPFAYTWSIVEAPCDDLSNLVGEMPQGNVINHNGADFDAPLRARAPTAGLVSGNAYCALVSACVGSEPPTCVISSSDPVIVDAAAPVVHAGPLALLNASSGPQRIEVEFDCTGLAPLAISPTTLLLSLGVASDPTKFLKQVSLLPSDSTETAAGEGGDVVDDEREGTAMDIVLSESVAGSLVGSGKHLDPSCVLISRGFCASLLSPLPLQEPHPPSHCHYAHSCCCCSPAVSHPPACSVHLYRFARLPDLRGRDVAGHDRLCHPSWPTQLFHHDAHLAWCQV